MLGDGKAKEEVKEINSELVFTLDALTSINEKLMDSLQSFTESIEPFKSGVETVSKEIQRNLNTELKNAVKNTLSLSDLQTKINLGKITEKDIEKETLKLAENRQRIENLKNAAALQLGGITEEQNNLFEQQNNQLNIQDIILKQIKEKYEEIKQEEEELNKSLGITGNLISGLDEFLKKLGFGDLSKSLNLPGVLNDVKKLGPGASSFQKMSTFAKSLGKNLMAAIKPIDILIIIVKELIAAFKASDKIVGDMAKGLNMSYGEALAMKQELTAAANASGDIFVNSKGMAESLMSINKTLGTNVMLNKEDLTTFTKLREAAGFTNDELMGIQSLSLATGKSLEDNTKEFMAQAKISSLKNGIALNEKQIAKEVKDLSAATTLSLGKNPKLLGEAVAVAKSFGLEMSKIEAIAGNLLNFEQSIESELQAELLLGKNINLEKARLAALNNDIATVAEEIAKQAGSAEEFGRLNRIQQEALAGAVGMGREELAKTLFIQEQLKGATGDTAKEREKILNARIAEVGLEQAQRELQDEGFEKLQQQASVQDRFNKSIEKLREIFVTVVEAMMPMIDILSLVFDVAGLILKPLGAMMSWANSFGKVMGGIVGLLTAAGIAALVINSSLTFGIGAAIALAAIGGGMALLEKNKAQSQPVADMLYESKGKTTVSTKEGGLFELSPNDDLIAAPGISRALSSPQNNQPIIINNDKSETMMEKTNMLLEQILNKQARISMNATEVGTSFSINTYEIQ
jgi:hypothetical protein